MLYSIYTSLGTACLPFFFLAALANRFSGKTIFKGIDQRLVQWPPCTPAPEAVQAPTIWLHAASVGEVQVAEKLIRELEQSGEKRFFLTTMTRTGLALARERLGPRATCFLAPLDVHWLVRKAIARTEPDLFICIETELWPAMLTAVHRAGIPMALINGRLSKRSFSHYKKIARFMQSLLAGFQVIAAISERDAQRFAELAGQQEHTNPHPACRDNNGDESCGYQARTAPGFHINHHHDTSGQQGDESRRQQAGAVPGFQIKIIISGNSKHGGQYHDAAERNAVRHHYKKKLVLGNRTVFLCGSTRSGEEELLLPVHRQLQRDCDGQLTWIIAPRHLERIDGLVRFFRRQGMNPVLFSQCRADMDSPELVLVDCMGELVNLYAAGDYNFCGGSLVEKGGHNIMEAVSWGLPVYFGPHMDDFVDAANLVTEHGAGFQVSSPEELARLLMQHQNNQEAYEQACQAATRVASMQNRAIRRQAKVILDLLAADRNITNSKSANH